MRPEAIAAMAELGIDISSHSPKSLERFLGETWDEVITFCDSANETCPIFPGARDDLRARIKADLLA